jgi:hypothetical protein
MKTPTQYFPLRLNGRRKPVLITRAMIESALKDRNLKAGPGRKFAVAPARAKGSELPKVKLCSPREVIRHAIKLPDAKFNGGHQTNEVFKALGFLVGTKTRVEKDLRKSAETPRTAPRLNSQIKELLKRKWETLPIDKDKLRLRQNLNSPGVYLLAFDSPSLRSERIEPEDIWYVGMTNEGGLANRLCQFISSAAGGGGHSAGDRFRKIWLKRQDRDLHSMKPLFACLEMKCETDKPLRSARDRRRMGTVAALEYEILADIKEKTGYEPILNKK